MHLTRKTAFFPLGARARSTGAFLAFELVGAALAFGAACNTATLDEPASVPPNTDLLPDSGKSSADAGSDSALAEAAAPRDAANAADAPASSADVSIVVEPGNDKGQALLDAVQNAKTSVHMTMYLLTNTNMINALISQKNASHDVKVVLNQNFPSGQQGSNDAAFNQLKGAGVNVVWAPSAFTYTHAKCIILDGATAWIMTMNSTQTSAQANREYLAVDTDPADVAATEQLFQADFAGTTPNVTTKLVVAPTNAKPSLLGLLNAAHTSIDVEGEELSDTDFVSTLVARAGAGVTVRVVLSDASPTPAQQSAVQSLKTAKIPVVSLSSPYVHAKAIVVDGTRAYVGSANFTTGSMVYNREIGVLIDGRYDPATTEVGKVASTIAADFAAGTAL